MGMISDWIDIGLPAGRGKTLGSTNAAALTAVTAKVATITKPVTDLAAGRLIYSNTRGAGSVNHALLPLVQGADNDVVTANVWGWCQCNGVWIPTLLLVLTGVTACALVGPSAGASHLNNTWRFCDAITIGNDYTFGTAAEAQVTGGVASIVFDAMDFELIEVETTTNGGAATAVRWLQRILTGAL